MPSDRPFEARNELLYRFGWVSRAKFGSSVYPLGQLFPSLVPAPVERPGQSAVEVLAQALGFPSVHAHPGPKVLKFVAMVLLRSTCLKAAIALAIATAAPVSMAIPAIAASVGDWRYSPQTGQLGFDLDSAEQPKYFLMANPMRIVVDLPGTAHNLQALEAQAGGVFTQIRAAKAESGQTRLVLQLAPGTVLQPGQVELMAEADGRWSLRPLLAEGQVFSGASTPIAEAAPGLQTAVEATAPSEVAVLSAASDEFDEFMDGPPEMLAESSEPVLPTLGAMETGEFEAEAELASTEFVSMEETLERQRAIAAAPSPEQMPGEIPDEVSRGMPDSAANREVAWGSSQLPPVPTNLSSPTALDDQVTVSASTATLSAVLPQLPQPQLGQAPFAFSAPEQSALVDPAQVVDVEPLRQSPQSLARNSALGNTFLGNPSLGNASPSGAAFTARPPAAVEPVMDPKLLSVDGQSAAVLGGQTGLVLERGSVPAVPVALPVVAPAPVVEQQAGEQQAVPQQSLEQSVPFLVEFGAPLPGVSPNAGAL